MKIVLYGAAGGEVTGSAYHIQTDRASVLLDFGMFQGHRKVEDRNCVLPKCNLAKLDAVLVTHGHLDHTGRLPLLVKAGYSGPILCTPATIEMAGLILRDSAKIQAGDNERINRKRTRAGEDPIEPLYTAAHVETLLGQFIAVPYNDSVAVAPGITARFVEAGHMLGSTSIQLTVEEKGRPKTVVFSGDLGPLGAPILKDFEPFHKADVVFLESTYGDRDHKPFNDTVKEFIEIVKEVVARKGKILVPTFAVGRAQLLLTLLAGAFRNKKLPPFPVYLDSPMAVAATEIYRHHPELFDAEMTAFIKQRGVAADLEMAKSKISVTAQDSMALNDAPGPCMILAGAGMCNAGRIVHHLRNNLFKPETAVLIVGFQAEGSLGRQLVDGSKLVSIFGEKVAVKASIHTLGGFSAHAGQTDLLKWLGAMTNSRPRVVLVHGEDRAREPFAEKIQERFRIQAELPSLEASVQV